MRFAFVCILNDLICFDVDDVARNMPGDVGSNASVANQVSNFTS